MDVERFLGYLAGHQLGRALGENAEFARATIGLGLGTFLKAVHLGEQPAPVIHAGGIHGKRWLQIRHGKTGRTGIRLDGEGRRLGAKVGGAAAVVHVRQTNIGRNGSARAELVGDDRAHCRMLIIGLEAAVETADGMKAGEHVMIRRTMARVAVCERPHQRKLVHHFRRLGNVLADMGARHVGADGIERAADFTRRLGLHIKSINRTKAALEENENEINVALRFVDVPLRRCLKQPTHGKV